jgi:hypothetical protein
MSTDNSTCVIMGLVGSLLKNFHLFLCGALSESVIGGGRHFMTVGNLDNTSSIGRIKY